MKKLFTILSVCTALLLSCCSCSEKAETSDDSSSAETSEDVTMATNSEPLDTELIQPILDYFEGFNTKNAELVACSFTPQLYIDYMKENGTFESYVESSKNDIENTYNDLWIPNYGENSQLEFVEELSNSTLPEESLKGAKKYFDRTYCDVECEIEIEEGYELTYNYRISGDDDFIETTEKTCLVKIKGEGWKPVFCPASTLDYYAQIPD